MDEHFSSRRLIIWLSCEMYGYWNTVKVFKTSKGQNDLKSFLHDFYAHDCLLSSSLKATYSNIVNYYYKVILNII